MQANETRLTSSAIFPLHDFFEQTRPHVSGPDLRVTLTLASRTPLDERDSTATRVSN